MTLFPKFTAAPPLFNTNLLMLLKQSLLEVLMELNPAKYKQYLLSDGTMWARVNKAVYGTGDAARLWYLLVHKTLIDNGFTMNVL